MMSDKENKRKCLKCGSSPAEDGVKLFRFPNPGVRNLFRCESWASYVFPDRNNSFEVQKKLYSQYMMICERHFKETDFTDSNKKLLSRNAIPCDQSKHEPPVCLANLDLDNLENDLVVIVVSDAQPIPSSESTETEGETC